MGAFLSGIAPGHLSVLIHPSGPLGVGVSRLEGSGDACVIGPCCGDRHLFLARLRVTQVPRAALYVTAYRSNLFIG